jgi:hypothetical protein
MNKLLVLDIDGVLNNSRPKKLLHRTYHLHPDKIKLLNKIITETKCKILLSSTWRMDFTGSSGINMFFEAVGICPECIGITPHLNTNRGTEILTWIIKEQFGHGFIIDSLCILDDDNDMGILSDYLIRTDNTIGLTKEDAKQANIMLSKLFEVNLILGKEK